MLPKFLPIWFAIFLAAQPGCLGSELVNNLLTILTNTAIEIDRIFGLLVGRQDFNRWFLSKTLELETKTDDEYDFIIVGSGSSGSVIANRLSEVGSWKILLLECGIQETGLMDIPLIVQFFAFTRYNWHYVMEYQENNFFGLEHNRMLWPRGKALGGTTTINYMIYTRGNRWDYDRWANDGNPGWSYKDVLPYYMKSERANNLTEYDPSIHGTDGYLSVENIYRSKLTDTFIEAGPYVGLDQFDYNANEKSLGVAQIQGTIKNGQRHSVATAFLYPVRDRPNLKILTRAYVTKILIDPQTKKAYGVTYDRFGRSHTVLAKKEIIISAGTLNTPQLLMLSGIGPQKHLDELGIKTLVDLPVGRFLQDHLCFPGLTFEMDEPYDLNLPRIILSIPRYIKNHTGPFTSLGGVEGIGYIKTSAADYPEDYPDMELLFVGGTLALDGGLATYRSFNIRDQVFDSAFRPLAKGNAWQIIPMHIHPKSVGYMELRSKNPYDHPKFYGNFFTDPEGYDVEAFLEAVRFVQKLAKTPPFKKIGTRLNPRPMHTCEHLPFDSDDYWRCCIRSISLTLHHQVGTAKMGPPEDPTAVVNHNFQVYGVENLRVADCSIIPRALGAHTNAPAIMVGEKASDIIKLYYGKIKKQ